MATEWFCKIMGDEQGPMTAAELHTLARAGRLTIDDLVRKHADGSWVRAENVIGLFDRPSLPVVLKESIAVIDDFASVAASWQATVGRTAAGGQRCSLAVETTQSRSACSRTAAESTVCDGRPAVGRSSSAFVVPRRTLKVGAGATAKAVAEKLANQTTQTAGFNSLADTVSVTSGSRGADDVESDSVKQAVAIGGANAELQQLVGRS